MSDLSRAGQLRVNLEAAEAAGRGTEAQRIRKQLDAELAATGRDEAAAKRRAAGGPRRARPQGRHRAAPSTASDKPGPGEQPPAATGGGQGKPATT